MDVGATLQSAREARGLSIEELSDRTKISVRLLRAVERNATDALPPGIFTRGYLRAYAKEVGLDPSAIVDSYLAQSEGLESSARGRDEQRAGRLSERDLIVPDRHEFDPSAHSGNEAGKALAIGLASLAFVAYLSLGRSPDSATPELALPVEAVPAAVDPGAAVVPASDVNVPVATTGSTLEIEIAPSGPCWVEATVDGNRHVYRLMNPGDRETMTVHEDLTLRVGDPSSFRFSINGRAGQVPGRAGQPITVRIDAENASDFLAR